MGVALSQQVHLLVHPFKSCGFFLSCQGIGFQLHEPCPRRAAAQQLCAQLEVSRISRRSHLIPF